MSSDGYCLKHTSISDIKPQYCEQAEEVGGERRERMGEEEREEKGGERGEEGSEKRE